MSNEHEEDFVEVKILGAVRKLLVVRVNEILGDLEFPMPAIEFGEFAGVTAVSPAISLSNCERSEKERIIRLDAYFLAITFSLPETPESELHCYAYASAICMALEEDSTLGGIVDRTVISGKKYVPPKKPNCGVGWEMVLTLRITVEGTVYAG